jgi:hypothetical protein
MMPHQRERAYAALHLILIIAALVSEEGVMPSPGDGVFYLAMLPASRIVAFGDAG